jgi:cellulose synthase operon protein C
MRCASPLAWLLIAGLAGLGGCGMFRKPPPDDEPTLASLKGRSVAVQPDAGIPADEGRAIAAYRKFLEAAPNAPQRPQAMRRLGDLEMDGADRRLADGDSPDYRAAITRYQDYLKAYPKDAGNDRVLYQLARAQEQGGEVEVALKTLTRLVGEYPGTSYADEAQFRRGELLFATRDYAGAETAYATVLRSTAPTPYHERALYMQGWSLFKQGRLEDALRPFFGVLDLKLGAGRELSRADGELVDDTFRVTSIAFASLQGAASIPPFIDSPTRLQYEYRVYEQLGELYVKQERVKDAADTFGAFARTRPLHAQAPVLLSRVIEIYEKNGFTTLALEAKKDYVVRYGVNSEFRRANPEGWEQAQALVKTHGAELARHYHALAQKSKQSADVQEAVRWYRAWLESFPEDAGAAQNRFLLAELLFEDKRFAEAALEYETVAYGAPGFARGADAGYTALLSYAAQPDGGAALQRTAIASAQRFADAFPADPRAGSVLTRAAEQLFALKDGAAAAALARRALALSPPEADRRTAWTVIAHEAFERQAWADAERAYGEVLALTADNAAGRAELVERVAASVYQQAAAARAADQPRDAVALFERVASVAPNSPVRATAQYDAAAALIGLKDWDGAARSLEDFRRRFPDHPLQADVAAKLATAYLAKEQWSLAAAEFDRIAEKAEPDIARAALWQAAELRDKAGDAGTAKAYENYLRRYPQPLEPAVQARWRLAQLSTGARSLAWMKEIVGADAAGGTERSERTRAWAASASLALAEPVFEAYRKVALVEPLAKQLKAKKARMEEVLKAYAAAAEYGVAEVTTASTFRTAALYQDFGRALIGSQRPKKLNKAELEQYNVMLEEQAFPFEEKAIELHEGNARRAAAGVWDEWVRQSYAALAQLKPGRWARAERSDPASPLNERGIALRGEGKFAQAREAYEQAIAVDPRAVAPVLNLAILNDLYLGDAAQALGLYERVLTLSTPADATVTKWATELRSRRPAAVVSRKDTP